MAIYTCLFLVVLLYTPSNHALPTNPAAKPLARFSDLLLPLEEAPLDIVGADEAEAGLGVADSDDAIDKMFASYEKQFLHELKPLPVNLPLSFIRGGGGGGEHNIRSRDTVAQVVGDAEEGSGSQSPDDQQVVAIVQQIVADGAASTSPGYGERRAIDATDDLVANVYIDGDNAERNRLQHAVFSFGLGSRWAELMAHTDRPVTEGIVMEEPPVHVAVDASELNSDVAIEGNARHGRQLFHSANVTTRPQEATNSSADSIPETSIELIDAVPAEESFVAALKVEPVVTRSELLHDESLVPSVPDVHRESNTLDANEVHIIDENQKEAAELQKTNASETIMSTLVDGNLLTNSDDGLAPIVPAKEPLKMAQAAANTDSVEGSGDDLVNVANVLAIVVDLDSEADADKSFKIINTLNDSAESGEDDSNTAAENHDVQSSRSHKSDSAADNDDDDDDDDKDDDDDDSDDHKKTSSVVSGTSDILRAIVEAVDLSKEIDSSIQSFRETADENSAVRQTRSETVAIATANSLAAPTVDSIVRLAGASSTTSDVSESLAAARSRQMHLVSALVGYGAMVASLSVTLAIGVWFVYRRVHEARHVLIIANV